MTPQLPWRDGIGGPRPRGVLTVRAGERWVCVLLCPGLEIPGCDVHWLAEQEQSVPCIGADACRLCKGGNVPQWKGYAPVLTHLAPLPYCCDWKFQAPLKLRELLKRSRKVALEITAQCHDLHGCCEGTAFVLGRQSGRRNGRLDLQIPQTDPVPVHPAARFDTKPLVQAMWAHHFKGGE